MIEVCYCSPNMQGGRDCNYCQAKTEIMHMLSSHLDEMTEADFDRIFSNYNISTRAGIIILDEIQNNEYAG